MLLITVAFGIAAHKERLAMEASLKRISSTVAYQSLKGLNKTLEVYKEELSAYPERLDQLRAVMEDQPGNPTYKRWFEIMYVRTQPGYEIYLDPLTNYSYLPHYFTD